MARYVENNLRPSERLIAKATISTVPLVPTFLMSFLLVCIGAVISKLIEDDVPVVIAFIVAIICVIIGIIKLKSTELGVTDKKIIGKTGVIVRQSLDAYLEKIDNFALDETFFGRLFGYSTIQICTTSARMRFGYIKDAMAFKHIVMDCIDAREKERLYTQAQYIHQLSDPNFAAAPPEADAQETKAIQTPSFMPQGNFCA
jgi:uncharacterized membrane protein YdbT with pleckstrin-like domain